PASTGINPTASSHRLVGVVGRDFLWNVADGLPATVAARLWDTDAGMLFSTTPDSLRLTPKAAQALVHSGNGTFEWKGDSGRYLATYSSLPPGRRFHLPRWRLVMTEAKA